MTRINTMVRLCLSLLIFHDISVTLVRGGQIIGDTRVTSKDVLPSLGRGFSATAGTWSSVCLNVVEEQDITFDYDYTLLKITRAETAGAEMAKLESSISVSWLRENVLQGFADASARDKQVQFMTTILAVDKYFTGLDDAKSRLDDAPLALLDASDYLGFLQACGTSFVRTVRRRTESAALLSFEINPDDEEFATAVEQDLMGSTSSDSDDDDDSDESTTTSASGEGASKASKYAAASTMTIRARAFGLDLQRVLDPAKLVINGAQSYHVAMQAFFDGMVGNPNTGLVASVEIVSWANNFQFQESTDLATVMEREGTPISSQMRKLNFVANAEHFLNINAIVEAKFEFLGKLMKCQQEAAAIPPEFEDHHLFNYARYVAVEGETLGTGNTIESQDFRVMSPQRLRMLLEGRDETQTGHHQYQHGRMLDSANVYVRHYYSPCITRLTEDDLSLELGTMFTMHWLDFEECNQITCAMGTVEMDPDSGMCTTVLEDPLAELVDTWCVPQLMA